MAIGSACVTNVALERVLAGVVAELRPLGIGALVNGRKAQRATQAVARRRHGQQEMFAPAV